MTPERLAEIRQEVRWFLDGKVHKLSDDCLEDLLTEVGWLQGQLDRLQRVLLAEWEKDSENYRRLMQLVGESNP